MAEGKRKTEEAGLKGLQGGSLVSCDALPHGSLQLANFTGERLLEFISR